MARVHGRLREVLVIDELIDQLARRIDAPVVLVPPAIQDEVDQVWRESLAKIELAAARARFLADGELLVVPDVVPERYVARVLAELDAARPRRTKIPLIRSAQHVGWRALQRVSPRAAALYR